MRSDNEAKMKAILDELEDELSDEKEEEKEEIESLTEEETLEEDFKEEKVEDKNSDRDEEEDEEDVKEEEPKEKKKEVKVEKKEEDLEIKESAVRKVGNFFIDKLNKYKYVIILDIVVFLFLFFLIPTIILEVKPILWMSLFLIFIIIPTVAFYLGRLYKKYQILFSIPFFYLCILSILDNCTVKDLYGITSHGSLDKTPAWVDAIFVTFIIVFFQYLGLCAIDFARNILNKNKKKKAKKD